MDKWKQGMGILLFLLLVVFFAPKNAGHACGFCGPPPSIQRTELGCLGMRMDFPPMPNCADCGSQLVCFGWVTPDETCYTRIDSREPLQRVSCP